jgi:hypothetical protein
VPQLGAVPCCACQSGAHSSRVFSIEHARILPPRSINSVNARARRLLPRAADPRFSISEEESEPRRGYRPKRSHPDPSIEMARKERRSTGRQADSERFDAHSLDAWPAICGTRALYN